MAATGAAGIMVFGDAAASAAGNNSAAAHYPGDTMRKGMVFGGILACTLWLGSFSRVSAASLVADGDFESPVLSSGGYVDYGVGSTFGGSGSDWTVVGPGGAVSLVSGTFTQSGLNFVAQGGSQQWMDLAGQSTNPANGVQQILPTINGQTYNLSFWVGNVYDPGGFFSVSTTVNVFLDGLPFMTAVNNSSSNPNQFWQNFTATFVATGPTTLAFYNGDPTSDYNSGLDSVSVTAATPLPAAFPLFVTGLASLGWLARRRRKQAAV